MVKVTIAGAAGGIGQTLSLLCKLNPDITELSLYDIANAEGVAVDLSHVNSPARATGHQPRDKSDQDALKNSLIGSDIVIIPAGVPRKPGMTRQDLFKINAGIVRSLVGAVAKYCPEALLLIISNPVNSTVVIAAEELKKNNCFNPRKLFGVTTLDLVRAETFLSYELNYPVEDIRGKITVVGGHSGDTIVPLIHINTEISKIVSSKLSPERLENFIHRVQYGGDEVVQAKSGKGSATLSMAYAGYRFTETILNAITGKENKALEPAYIYLPGVPGGEELSRKLGVEYFAVPIEFDNKGEAKRIIFNNNFISKNYEAQMIEIAKKSLTKSIVQGQLFVNGSKL
ncbi:hypothetical protein PACTADRAFT_44288 [Pachysolen tannophilus NRRL Y-2460]|uniref:Malate dehydrogenase n=1 Tax=Pachysolen tannophilus NRRL Y-2460 TaxID=669874 RepID=A0A1E4TSB3_PACTA|nr:hypothetical protein PACTADRAFT_44288 [Pachysolen tannophilus NRRL Y-2460]